MLSQYIISIEIRTHLFLLFISYFPIALYFFPLQVSENIRASSSTKKFDVSFSMTSTFLDCIHMKYY